MRATCIRKELREREREREKARRKREREFERDAERVCRVLWVSMGSSGGGLEAGRHEGTRGATEEGVSRPGGGGEVGWTVGL